MEQLTGHGPDRRGPAVREPRWIRRRVLAVLLAGGLVGVVAGLPYTSTLLRPLLAGAGADAPPLSALLALQAVQTAVLVGAATALGLRLGPAVGLGAPDLAALVARRPGARARLRAVLAPAVGAGIAVSAVVVALDLWVFSPRLPPPADPASAAQPPAWQGLLAALYGGISEELLLRLGIMTVLVWLATRWTRSRVPTPAVLWTAVVVTALLFGIGHLPATATVWPLTPLVVARALLLNGLSGLVFGWLYWRRGLLAAMLAHLGADLVLHAVTPLLVR